MKSRNHCIRFAELIMCARLVRATRIVTYIQSSFVDRDNPTFQSFGNPPMFMSNYMYATFKVESKSQTLRSAALHTVLANMQNMYKRFQCRNECTLS